MKEDFSGSRGWEWLLGVEERNRAGIEPIRISKNS